MRLITFAGARSLGTSIFRLGCFFLRIVMAISGDAIATGIVTSLARPEANLTGSTFFLPELNAKRLEVLKEACPQVARVAALSNPNDPAKTNHAGRKLDLNRPLLS